MDLAEIDASGHGLQYFCKCIVHKSQLLEGQTDVYLLETDAILPRKEQLAPRPGQFYLLRRSRKAEDDKYDDFLKRYRLTDRIVRDEQVFERRPDTDYSHAGQQLAEDVRNSLAYLDKALEECAE